MIGFIGEKLRFTKEDKEVKTNNAKELEELLTFYMNLNNENKEEISSLKEELEKQLNIVKKKQEESSYYERRCRDLEIENAKLVAEIKIVEEFKGLLKAVTTNNESIGYEEEENEEMYMDFEIEYDGEEEEF